MSRQATFGHAAARAAIARRQSPRATRTRPRHARAASAWPPVAAGVIAAQLADVERLVFERAAVGERDAQVAQAAVAAVERHRRGIPAALQRPFAQRHAAE